jgi:hypothetical protein
MEKRIATLAVALVVVGACSSVVLALPPMGPPKAMVGQDQWTVGLGFSHSEMDLEAHGIGRENMGLGLVGAADGKDDITEDPARASIVPNQYTGFDSSFEICYGIGSRVSFWEDADITWGGLFQIIWQNPDGSIDMTADDPGNPPAVLAGDAELDFWELQIAVGPTWEGDNFRVYGGPFLHVVDGDIDLDTVGVDSFGTPWQVESSGDIREASQFGGYAGAQWLVAESRNYKQRSDAARLGQFA